MHCKCLCKITGWLEGVSAISARKTCNICRDFPTICKYYRVFPADIAEIPSNHPVILHKHLQCALSRFKELPTDLFVYVPQARSSHKKIFKNQSSRLSYMYNRELALDWRNTLSKIIKNSSNAWCYYWICVFLLSLNSIFVWVMYF